MDPAGMEVTVELQMTALSLYHYTQQGDWKEALTTLKKNPGIHEMPINSSGDTLLHVALNDYKDDWAKEIMDEIKKNPSWSALGIKNNRGDTPLHCAASIGSLKMCEAIAEAQRGGDNQLMIEARNKKGETPLFLAALHGHKDAFLFLHHFRCPDQSSRLWRRTSDSETVLHCTIRREHFDLAFQIILLYGDDIVGSVDEKGITPLHILADKPSAFESSSNFRWYNKLVYNCLIVKPLMGSLERQSNNNDTLLNRTGADAENRGYVGYNNVAPPNYWTCCDILVRLFICFIQPLVETFGFLQDIEVLKKKKQKHIWCRQILDEIWVYKDVAYVGGGSAFLGYSLLRTDKDFPKPHQIGAVQGGGENITMRPNDGGNHNQQDEENKAIKKVDVDHNKSKELGELLTSLFKGKTSVSASKALTGCCIYLGDGEKKEESDKKESAFFIAAKNGVLEILEKIMKDKPGAIHETNSQGQNVLHVAVESRQPHAFNLFKKHLESQRMWGKLINSEDNAGNNILHTAAKSKFQIQGSSALQMLHDIKWYQYVKSLVPSYVTFLPNCEDKTPEDIFLGDHKDLVQKSDEWLCRTSESCSVVAALVAGVAFATSSTVPGGNDDKTGKPTLEGHAGFDIFAITALIALCFSVTALILFLSLLTSRKQAADYLKKLPVKLFLALSSLFNCVHFLNVHLFLRRTLFCA